MVYNPIENNFTVFKAAETPKITIPDFINNKDIDFSDFAVGYAEDGETPIMKPEKQQPSIIVQNTEEYEGIPYQPIQYEQKEIKPSTSIGDRQKYAMDFFISKGLEPHQAAGIVGNLMLESGDKTLNKTDAIGDKKFGPAGSSYGIAQWRLDRRTGLKNFAAKRGKPMSDFETQLEYVWEEINSSQKPYKVLEGLLNSKTAEEAAESFMKSFERPSSDPKINGIEKRKKYAKSLLN